LGYSPGFWEFLEVYGNTTTAFIKALIEIKERFRVEYLSKAAEQEKEKEGSAHA
jgi:hypothetical protein